MNEARAILVAMILLFCAYLYIGATEATKEDTLRLQVVLLKGQLAESLKAHAKCEAEGSQAMKQLQEAQTEGQALIKALEARGLTVNAQNEIVPKPKEESK